MKIVLGVKGFSILLLVILRDFSIYSLLSEDVEAEERAREEMALFVEVDRLQREIEQAKHGTEVAHHSAETLRSQVDMRFVEMFLFCKV